MDQQTVIRSQAKPGAGKPPGAMNSAFDTGASGKPRRRAVAEPVDPSKLQIERGVPLPPAITGPATAWASVYARMSIGDMVRLTKTQAKSFVSWGSKNKGSLACRTLGPDSAGVWRVK